MRRPVAALFTLVILSASTAAAERASIRFETNENQVVIRVAGMPLATYVLRDAKIPRPYLAHVHGPGGTQVTRIHPPVAGKDATDHATYHPGIFLAFGDVSGHDDWRLKAKVAHEKFLVEPTGGPGRGSFAVRNRYLSTDGKSTVCREDFRLDVFAKPYGHLLIWTSNFASKAGDFYFGDQEEMGLGIRVATPISVRKGGRITNSDGLVNERGCWGKQADWCDYSGVIDGRRVGMMLMPDPKNFRRCWFHARDYGFVAANPFGRNAFTRGENSKIVVPQGGSLQLRFGIVLHETPRDQPIDLKAAYQDFLTHVRKKD